MNGFFITGTNTDAGKTICTAALLRAMRGRGLDAVAAKPVQTGVVPGADGLPVAPDLQMYTAASGWVPAPEDRALVFQKGFHIACSPHLAAELEHGSIEAEEVTDRLRQLGDRHDWVLAEGAGGLLAPLNRRQTMLDLARLSGWPVLLVADNLLGMINHALLTLQVLRQNGINVAGVIINHTTPNTADNAAMREDNIRTVAEFGQTRILASLPHISGFSPASQEHWQRMAEALLPWVNTL